MVFRFPPAVRAPVCCYSLLTFDVIDFNQSCFGLINSDFPGSAKMKEMNDETVFVPDFAKGGGILPVVAQCAGTGEVLMLAYMDQEAFAMTVETGIVHYYSRTRKALWKKGGTSGHVQAVRAVRLDCDSDAILILIDQIGDAACHTGRRSCFYRELKDGQCSTCSPLIFDPTEVYK